MSDWKKRLGVLYSTNPDYEYEEEIPKENIVDLPANKQCLRVSLDRKKRRGKEVSLITGYQGSSESLAELARLLKQKCGVGGAAKDGEIIIQGNQVDKIKEILKGLNYVVK